MPRTPEQLVQNARENRRFAQSTGTVMLGDYLDAIFQTLDERLPAAPMTVIESAPSPVEDTPTEVQTHFECRSSPEDYLKIDDSYLNVVDRLYIDFFTEESGEDSIGLTKEDARILARSILSIVGEN